MSAHSYPWAATVADAARAACGFVLSAMPLCLIDKPLWPTALLGVLAAVFVLYGLAAVRRAVSPIDLGCEAICVRGPWPARLSWAEVQRLRLAHYSTRRDGSGGWMQLTLAGPDRRIVVDSRIGGFDVLARRAAAAARERAVRLDAATIVNLHALGIAIEPAGTVERTAP